MVEAGFQESGAKGIRTRCQRLEIAVAQREYLILGPADVLSSTSGNPDGCGPGPHGDRGIRRMREHRQPPGIELRFGHCFRRSHLCVAAGVRMAMHLLTQVAAKLPGPCRSIPPGCMPAPVNLRESRFGSDPYTCVTPNRRGRPRQARPPRLHRRFHRPSPLRWRHPRRLPPSQGRPRLSRCQVAVEASSSERDPARPSVR